MLAATQDLHAAQRRLHAMNGLYRDEAAHRINPGHYTLAEHFNTSRKLQIELVEVWRCQQFLPTEAANDAPSLPGVA